ncbi:helicase C-terminal domain-containing protein [bacterium]|nr:helicase C-terminal domain-containing protein [bacterium]
MTSQRESMIDFRRTMLDRLKEDLVGPLSPDEFLRDPKPDAGLPRDGKPSERYLTGILFPQDTALPPEEQESLSSGANDGPDDGDGDGDDVAGGVSLERSNRPSTAGVSFAISGDSTNLQLRVRGGTYKPAWRDSEGQATSSRPAPMQGDRDEDDEDPRVKAERDPKNSKHWQRRPHDIRVSRDGLPEGQTAIKLDDEGLPGFQLLIQVAPPSTIDGIQVRTVTAVLANFNKDERDGDFDPDEIEGKTLFQSSLAVMARKGTKLVPRPSRRSKEDLDLQLVYRDRREYAVGHTCSARWDTRDGDRVNLVETTWVPSLELKAVSPLGHESCASLKDETLSARFLAEADLEEVIDALHQLPSSYLDWLNAIEQKELAGIPAGLQEQARLHFQEAREAVDQMRRTIQLLANDSIAFESFQLANAAMQRQLEWREGDSGKTLVWRPFQLAFQLLVIESLAQPDGEGRDIMDLLWFPTGGGKTEAYLGLVAFSLFHRRLRHADAPDQGAGVAVLMRYTLRLLTIDQFQRSARLILACEHERRRRRDGSLGSKPFSIGLWVGGAASPNRYKEASKKVNDRDDPTPRQLEACPCCGSDLSWRANNAEQRVDCHCRSSSCELAREGSLLPIHTVDDQIYKTLPSLIIGTIDKFAQLTFNPSEAHDFFGVGGRNDPPDLVIQDELHLISGPLGSIAGLFEVALDELATRRNDAGCVIHRPKIIGSTATIKRARTQVRALFDRRTRQFPPAILQDDDSFFIRPATDEEQPGRIYAAVTTAGRSPKFALQAVYGSLLQSGEAIPEDDPKVRDPYWTLLGYFNALRELGASLVMLSDDVPASMLSYAVARDEEVPSQTYGLSDTRRRVGEIEELTSRKGQLELRETLDDLKEHTYPQPEAFDAVLATNMISVGVDVDRLGLMVVFAQPKQTAEYIQATSRVGRKHPGLILTVYKNSFARDRSHYETFESWNRALYRDVEPTSVTPFASRCRERMIPAAVVILAMSRVPRLARSLRLTSQDRESIEGFVISVFRDRVQAVDPDEVQRTMQDVVAFLDQWETKTASVTPQHIRKDNKYMESLLVSHEKIAELRAIQAGYQGLIGAPNSMRDVEPSAPYKLLDWDGRSVQVDTSEED